MADLLLFLYGTLRDPEILAAVLGRSPSGDDLVLATAPDCAAVGFPDRPYPALVRRAGSVAEGLLLKRVTPRDIAALDAFEGEEYRRGPIAVAVASAVLPAEVYWPAIPVPPSSPDWTLDRWTREHKQRVLARETALAHAARRNAGRP
jgi:hypothetical protein